MTHRYKPNQKEEHEKLIEIAKGILVENFDYAEKEINATTKSAYPNPDLFTSDGKICVECGTISSYNKKFSDESQKMSRILDLFVNYDTVIHIPYPEKNKYGFEIFRIKIYEKKLLTKDTYEPYYDRIDALQKQIYKLESDVEEKQKLADAFESKVREFMIQLQNIKNIENKNCF